MTPGAIMIRTSLTDPLIIDEIRCAQGLIGLALCPGMAGGDDEGVWRRDLEADMLLISQWRPDEVVSLMEDQELADLGVARLGESVTRRGLGWRKLPLLDGHGPDHRFERAWSAAGPALRRILKGGGKVLLHCRDGRGRAGMVAARLLVETGCAPAQAIGLVRAARTGALGSVNQEAWVMNLIGPMADAG